LILHSALRVVICFQFGLKPKNYCGEHHLLAIPSSAFGANWNGSILTSLASVFAPMKDRGAK
jgi:hypothetical protein